MNANGNSVAYALLTITSRFNQVLRAAVEILKGRISLYPPAVRRLEAEFAKMVGTEYGLMFTNATSGLEAALFSLGVKKNTKVGTVGYVIPSSYCSATALGAELTFIDIDEQTLNINVDQLVSKSGDDIDVLIVVHFYGNPCNMKRIMKWAEANGVWVVEDCSHCHGASLDGRMLGNWGHVGVFSLQGDKAIAAGEGAVAVTNSNEYYLKMAAYGHQKNYRSLPDTSSTTETLPPFGYGRKMRAHPIGASLALVELKYLVKKNKIFENWFQTLEEAAEGRCFRLQHRVAGAHRGGYALGVALIFDDQQITEEFKKTAKKSRIGFFQREYRESIKYFSNSQDMSDSKLDELLPVSTSYFDRVVFVPFLQFIDIRRWPRLIKLLKAL